MTERLFKQHFLVDSLFLLFSKTIVLYRPRVYDNQAFDHNKLCCINLISKTEMFKTEPMTQSKETYQAFAIRAGWPTRPATQSFCKQNAPFRRLIPTSSPE